MDHYQVLEIARTASQDEIRRAYRRLTSKYHPDVNDSPEANDRMAALNAAYAVLRNPSKRQYYDASFAASPEPPPREPGVAHEPRGRTAEPTVNRPPPAAPSIVCDRCHCIDETLAFVAFTYVWSLLILAVRGQRTGIFCSRCRAKLSFVYTIQVLLFGWWGIVGFFWSVPAFIINLMGGDEVHEVNAELGRILAAKFMEWLMFDEALVAAKRSYRHVPVPEVGELIAYLEERSTRRRRPWRTRIWRYPLLTNAAAICAIVMIVSAVGQATTADTSGGWQLDPETGKLVCVAERDATAVVIPEAVTTLGEAMRVFRMPSSFEMTVQEGDSKPKIILMKMDGINASAYRAESDEGIVIVDLADNATYVYKPDDNWALKTLMTDDDVEGMPSPYDLYEDDFKITGSEAIDGVDCWVIEGPNIDDRSGPDWIGWIGKTDGLMRQSQDGGNIIRIVYDRIDGIPDSEFTLPAGMTVRGQSIGGGQLDSRETPVPPAPPVGGTRPGHYEPVDSGSATTAPHAPSLGAMESASRGRLHAQAERQGISISSDVDYLDTVERINREDARVRAERKGISVSADMDYLDIIERINREDARVRAERKGISVSADMDYLDIIERIMSDRHG
jgi:hypothetical protein